MDIFVVGVQMGNIVRPMSVSAATESLARMSVHMKYPMARIVSVRSIKQALNENVILVDFKKKAKVI